MAERDLYDRGKRIFLEAIALEGAAREVVLARECGADRELRAVVDGLLRIEKDERPASAAVVLEQLAAIGPDALAAAPQAPAPVADPVARTSTVAYATPSPQTSLPGETFTPTAMTPLPTASKRRGPWIAATAVVVALA